MQLSHLGQSAVLICKEKEKSTVSGTVSNSIVRDWCDGWPRLVSVNKCTLLNFTEPSLHCPGTGQWKVVRGVRWPPIAHSVLLNLEVAANNDKQSPFFHWTMLNVFELECGMDMNYGSWKHFCFELFPLIPYGL